MSCQCPQDLLTHSWYTFSAVGIFHIRYKDKYTLSTGVH